MAHERVLQLIPATVPVIAVLKGERGEERYPVVCWALVQHDDEDGDGPYQLTIGYILIDGQRYLADVDAEGEFIRYEYGT